MVSHLVEDTARDLEVITFSNSQACDWHSRRESVIKWGGPRTRLGYKGGTLGLGDSGHSKVGLDEVNCSPEWNSGLGDSRDLGLEKEPGMWRSPVVRTEV